MPGYRHQLQGLSAGKMPDTVPCQSLMLGSKVLQLVRCAIAEKSMLRKLLGWDCVFCICVLNGQAGFSEHSGWGAGYVRLTVVLPCCGIGGNIWLMYGCKGDCVALPACMLEDTFCICLVA